MNKTYWIVAWKPRENYKTVLLSSKKPYYLKSLNSWTTQTNDPDWMMGNVQFFGDFLITKDYFEPRKVKISTTFVEKKKK